MMVRTYIGLIGLALVIATVGCEPAMQEPLSFEPNLVFAKRFEMTEEIPMQQVVQDAQVLLTEWFGTPDEPKLPPLFEDADYRKLLDLKRLTMASGPAPAGVEPQDVGLYRQLCVSCHGETGQGRGTLAASQNPYPRDYRMGVFKFKSTPRQAKPTRENMQRILVHGLNGSQMPLFNKLTQQQLDALIDYVIYLSMRGELERQMYKYAAFELTLTAEEDEPAERLYDVQSKDLKDRLDTFTEQLTLIADSWMNAPDMEQEFTPPTIVPVPGFTDQLYPQALAASVAKGKELFESPTSACSKCHGISGKGDGQQLPDFDDWTKDWTKLAGFEPTDVAATAPFLAIGAMKPQVLAPRNLLEGKLRGGSEPIDIYRRIRYGIAGSPMPAASIVKTRDEPGLLEEDLWHIVNYVRSLSQIDLSPTPAAEAKRL